MLHLVLITHGPDTCAAVHKEAGDMARSAARQVAERSDTNDVNVQGWWVDPPGHIFFMLVDAPSAHAVNTLMQELKLFLWNTIDIHPVITMEEATPLAAR